METEEASENTMSDIVEVVYNMDFKQMTIQITATILWKCMNYFDVGNAKILFQVAHKELQDILPSNNIASERLIRW